MKRINSYLLLLIILFSFNRQLLAQNQIPYGDNKDAGKYIILNGVRHYYEVYGTGKPLLLIHGNSTGIKSFAAQIDFFASRYRVYAVDCRGRGKSDLGDDTLSYMQQAKDMARFIDLLKLDSVNVIGKSDGGIIAIMMGIYFPEHLKKIVSFSANLEPDTNALYPESVAEIKNEAKKADSMLALNDISQNWNLIRQRNRMMEFQPHVTAEDLHKINVPVLVMSTDRDVIREEHTFFIYRNIRNANLAFIAGETHHVPKQNPDLFNALVEKYFSQPFKGNDYRFNN